MTKRIKFDFILLLVVLLLVAIGTVFIYSASSFKAQSKYDDSQYYLGKQMFRLALGFILMILFIKIDYHVLIKIAPVILALSFVLLLYVLVEGDTINGSRRSFRINGIPFQPSEFAKYALIFYLAGFLKKKGDQLKEFNDGFLPALSIILIIIFPIILEPDLGSGVLIFLISMILIFVAGASLYHLNGLAALAGLAISIFLKLFAYQRDRVVKFLDAIRGISEPPWQVTQSLISFGNGGIIGVGLGNSRQKMHFLPHPFTDFIYSIVGEELGLIGCFLLLILFMIFLWRGVRIAIKAPNKEGQLLALGITATIITYALFNAGIALNLLPVTGITMPFISYGGSSLITHFIAVGVLLNISMGKNPSSGSTSYSKRRTSRSVVRKAKRRRR